jgi:hypothetical protein
MEHWDYTDRPGSAEVRRRIARPFIYDVGSHTDCACGFVEPKASQPARFVIEGVDQRKGWTESIEAFKAWLSASVASGDVEILICWEGDEAEKPRRRTIRADAIAEVDFSSAQNQPLRLRVHA